MCKMDTLKVYYQNTRGLRTKTNEFYKNLCCNNYDIIVLTETWLNSSVLSSELFDGRYVVYRRDRESSGLVQGKEGGGVLIAVLKKINSKRVTQWESKCEDLWIVISSGNLPASRQIALCATYLPPPIQLSTLEHFINSCNIVFESCKNNMDILIIGDFNLSKIDWERIDQHTINCNLPATCKHFMDFINVCKLTQLNHIKNCSHRILDLVLSSLTSCDVSASTNNLVNIDRHHPPLNIDVNLPFKTRLPYVTNNLRPNFFKADYNKIQEYINSQDWDHLIGNMTNVNEMVEVFYETLQFAIKNYVPLCTPKSKHFPPWFNKEIIMLLKEKNNVRCRFKTYRNPMDELQLKLLNKRCKKLSRILYKSYLCKTENNIRENPKLFWNHVKNKRGGTSAYPLTMTDGHVTTTNCSEISNLFADYFSSVYTTENVKNFVLNNFLDSLEINSLSLTIPVIDKETLRKKLQGIDYRKGSGPDGIPPAFIVSCASALLKPLLIIYNKSLSSGIFPKSWKNARVVPVFKSGKEDVISNYRPISILASFAKIFESLLCPYIQRHLRLYLKDQQHGFVGSRSTATNLMTFTESLIQAVDSGKQYDVIYTDFTKAFDKVSHGILMRKLSVYGIHGPLLSWFDSYLKDRSFSVVINGSQSSSRDITSGVPQGSHLGPILFNLYINDAPDCLRYSDVFMYADDFKFARIIDKVEDTRHLQEDLNALTGWCKDNKMILNSKKCFHVKFSRKKRLINADYYIGGDKIQEVETIKDLGVVFDNKVTFIPHIEAVTCKASKTLGFVIRNTKDFKNTPTKILLYNSFVRSILEYCCVVWRPHYATHTLRLERVQKRFLWHLSFSLRKNKELQSYNARLCYFNIDPLVMRMDRYDVVFIYKLLRGNIDSPTLLQHLRFRAPSRMPRSSIPPFCPPLRRTVLGVNSPVSRLSKMVNRLSQSIDLNFDSRGMFYKTVTDLLHRSGQNRIG